MNMNNNITKYAIFAGIIFALVFSMVSVVPTQANACIKALGFLDPLCVIRGDVDLPQPPPLPNLPSLPDFGNNDAPQTINNTYTNSNNVNSNINSPGATVDVNGGNPIAYYPAPVYNYDYDYHYDYDYDNYGPLQVSCYPIPLTIDEGERVTWHANAYGGTGSYHYSWDGNDGLSGTGQSVSKRYNNSGYKNATVTVRSGNQVISRNCDGSVNVRDNNYNYGYDYNYYPNYYNSLSVSCSPQVSSATVGYSVRWNAYVSGGNGSYGYSWNGTDGLTGSSQSIYRAYSIPGTKYASITVWSNGQTVTKSCSNSVLVGGYAYGVPQYPYPTNQGGLDIACYSDPRTVTVNQPATWITEVTGGIAPYTYSWTGSDGLTGSASSITKYYVSPGSKNAIVTITSADGRSETRACSTSITVRSAYTEPAPVQQQPVVQPDQDDDNGLSAAALFSLKNVPWGWVAILIILVLFGTVVYLIYNRPKI